MRSNSTTAHSPVFTWLTRMRLKFIQWRTVRLMRQIDADTGSALWVRDIEIPDVLTRLAREKYGLQSQLYQVTSELDALANR